MGVFLCIGQDSHGLTKKDSVVIGDLEDNGVSMSVVDKINWWLTNIENNIFLFLGSSKHKIKKKAEQSACKIGYEKMT